MYCLYCLLAAPHDRNGNRRIVGSVDPKQDEPDSSSSSGEQPFSHSDSEWLRIINMESWPALSPFRLVGDTSSDISNSWYSPHMCSSRQKKKVPVPLDVHILSIIIL